MAKFVVNLKDPESGAVSPIDNVIAEDWYNARKYISDCERYADREWVNMIHKGEISVERVEEI
jgi:hypothetical protein